MSYISWNTRDGTEKRLFGSERAHMGIMTEAFAAMVINRNEGFSNNAHRLLNVIPANAEFRRELDYRTYAPEQSPRLRAEQAASYYIRGLLSEGKIIYQGEEYKAWSMGMSTVIVGGNDTYALMARLHSQCELHCWVDESNREWLADVIDNGLTQHILRPGQSWEKVVNLLTSVLEHPGPVVTDYSVTDGFPSIPLSWRRNAWPGRMLATNEFSYSQLTEEEARIYDANTEAWYENFSHEEQWDQAFAELNPYLEITPENLHDPMTVSPGVTFFELIESEEWRKER